MKEIYMTAEGIRRLDEEIEQLCGAGRREIAERIKEARAFGDISENAEYQSAKEDQARMETRIVQLIDRRSRAVLVDEKSSSPQGVVGIGRQVEVTDLSAKKRVTYKVVGDGEQDLEQGHISYQSPVGRALMNHKEGDKVEVHIPRGVRQLRIEKIS